MSIAKKKALFKTAYFYNWDNGLATVKAIAQDKHCDKATAVMLFWHGSPGFYYNLPAESLIASQKEAFELLKFIEGQVKAGIYSEEIGYEVDKAFLPEDLSKIPGHMLEGSKGAIAANSILYPNNNPFQDQILALCQNCPDMQAMLELAEAGADFSLKILNGYAFPIQVAVNHGQLEALRYFIQAGFDLNAKYDKNPLFFSVVHGGHLEMLELMLQNGLQINAKGFGGRNALHVIAMMTAQVGNGFDARTEAVAKCLLQNGADPKMKDSAKLLPAELARKHGNEAFASFLESWTA